MFLKILERHVYHINYKLDPCHYVTSPGVAWDAMLKMTKINLDLITDIIIHCSHHLSSHWLKAYS